MRAAERKNLGKRALSTAEGVCLFGKQALEALEEVHRAAAAGEPLEISQADIRRKKVQARRLVKRFHELKERYEEAS